MRGNDPFPDAVGRGLDPAVRRFLLPGKGRGLGKFQPFRLLRRHLPWKGRLLLYCSLRLPSRGCGVERRLRRMQRDGARGSGRRMQAPLQGAQHDAPTATRPRMHRRRRLRGSTARPCYTCRDIPTAFSIPRKWSGCGEVPTPPSAFGRHLPYKGRLLLYCPSKAPLPGAAESSAACGGCSKANCLSRRHNRLFGDLIQKFALRSSLRSLPLRGKAAVAECKRLSKARSMMR